MTFESFAQFIAEVDYPPNKQVSLDRIVANGHYEPGNVRWASSHLQAVNKSKSYTGSMVHLDDLIAHHKSVAAKPAVRASATESWQRCLAALARGWFTKDDASWFSKEAVDPLLFEAGFELGQTRDATDDIPHFHLPSLSWPGRTIRLSGGPFGRGNELDAGTLMVLGIPKLNTLLPDPVVGWLGKDLEGPKPGAVWVGQISQHILDAGGPEGWMLAATARVRRHLKRSAVFRPMLSVMQALEGLGHQRRWYSEKHPVLDCSHLFIPDMQIDVGSGFDLKASEASALCNLLEYRRSTCRRTFVAVQNPTKLPGYLATELLAHLEVRNLDAAASSINTTPVHKVDTPVEGPPVNGLNFKQMKECLGA